MAANTPASTRTDPSLVSVPRDMCSAVMGRPVPVSVPRSSAKLDFAQATRGWGSLPDEQCPRVSSGVRWPESTCRKASASGLSPGAASLPPPSSSSSLRWLFPISSLSRGNFEAGPSPVS